MIRLALILLMLLAWSCSAAADGASHYGQGDGYYGKRTACGNIHRPGNTTAHRTLKCGTRVLITNTANGKSGVVVVNDRGPFVKGRTWDLNSSFARSIGITGVGNVRAQVQ